MGTADALGGMVHDEPSGLRPTVEGVRSLADLRAARLPRLDWRTIFSVSNPTCPCCEPDAAALEEMRPLDDYFRRFLPPGACVRCGAKQGGGILDQLLGAAKFTWSLAHGEGFCSACNYPARAYHRDVGSITFLKMILQYHPDELVERGDAG